MPRLLLIAAQASYHIAQYQAAGTRFGIEISVAAEGQYPIVPNHSAGLKIDLNDPKRSLSLIEEYHRILPLDGVLGADDSTVELAAMVAERLGLPGNTPKAAQISQRKDKAREVQRAAGLLSPPFVSLGLDNVSQILIPASIKIDIG